VTQAATAKPPVTVTALGTDPATDVLSSTREWAAAWSAKNSKKYLAFYAKEFKTPDGSSRSAWEAQRKERIAAPKSIHVELRDAKAKVADDKHVTVSFKQTYRASHLNVISSKTLNWVKTDGQWLITEERSGK
jgi:murein L,D-transpeptidase YafK